MSQFTHKYDRAIVNNLQLSQYGSAGNAWWGWAAVTSDTVGLSFVASTNVVASDSIIHVTLYTANAITSYRNTGGIFTFAVSCISPQGFFKYQTINSVAPATGSFTAAWFLLNPYKPAGVQ